MNKQTISAVINTFNEEENLNYVLRSVQEWVDEIIIVDMYSSDRTVEIAKSFGAKVFYYENMRFVEPARSYAVSQSSGDWILILDADELVPLSLKEALLEIVATNIVDIVYIPRLNYLLGKPMIGAGWGAEQDAHARFFRCGMLNFQEAIHSCARPADGARIYKLKYEDDKAIVHFNYINSFHFLEKLNRYTDIEANQIFNGSNHITLFVFIYKVVVEFIIRYVLKKGFLDGWRGLYLSLLMSMYQVVKFAKLKELSEVGNNDQIKAAYCQIAEKYLAQYNRNL